MEKDEDVRRELDLYRSIISQILESAAEGVVGLDPDGNCIFVNRAFFTMVGYSDDSSFIGSSLHDVVLCAKSDGCVTFQNGCCVMETVSAGKQYRNDDEELICADGRIIRVSFSASPLLSTDGAFIGSIVTIENNSEKRSLEEQLRQAQKIEAMGTLAGGVAHDFNNILTAIIGFGSLMEMKMTDDDPLLKSLQQILAAADRASDLTRSLLAFSRRQLTDIRRADLNRIVRGFEKMLKRLLREDIELQIELCAGDAPFMADAGQIEQILVNLATNSRDAMPTGGVIRITTERVMVDESFAASNGLAAAGRYLELVFRDSGGGMDDATLARIFDPQFTTKKESEGTGLGLSVCYGIVRKHHGCILCESTKGVGTAFTIYFPEAPQKDTRIDVSAALSHLRGNETLLFAEDDPSVRGLSRSTLERFGYKVLEAADGSEAVAVFRDNLEAVKLCVIDVIMPKKAGVDACNEIRAIKPEARILFISGYSEETLDSQNLPKDIEVLKKPLPPVKLLEAVRRALE